MADFVIDADEVKKRAYSDELEEQTIHGPDAPWSPRWLKILMESREEERKVKSSDISKVEIQYPVFSP